jgi:protein LTV1
MVEPVSEDDEDDEDLVKLVVEPPKDKWDCESILSKYMFLTMPYLSR